MGIRIKIGNIDIRNVRPFSWAAYWAGHSPSGLLITAISGGTRLTWTDNSDKEDGFEIYVSIDGGAFALLATVGANITTYDDMVSSGVLAYRVKAYVGANYSESAETIATINTKFVTTWNTELAGSATKTIVIPTSSAGFNCWVDWGDGGAEENFTGTAPAISHVYALAGIKTIKIRGAFQDIYISGAGDMLKLLTIENWGNNAWTGFRFYGCANLEARYTDYPFTQNIVSLANTFRSCTKFNGAVNFNTANVLDMTRMFQGCTIFNQPVTSFNTVKVTDMTGMFIQCAAFKQSLATFNLTALTAAVNMFYQTVDINTAGTTTNYDNTLISWAAQTVRASVSFDGGASKYSAGVGATARGILTGAPNSWTIIDGGVA